MSVKIEGGLQGSLDHFTDRVTSSQDKLAGRYMAEKIGDLYLDFNNNTPIDQWTQVMKALRVHGFKISFES